jgi:hypothetical protein
MTSPKHFALAPLAAGLLSFALVPQAGAQPTTAPRISAQPATAGPAGGAVNCNAPFGWWESPNLNPIFPANKPPPGPTDCDFQIWSWTAFVHWMQNDPRTGKPAFLNLPTPDDLASGDPARMRAAPRALVLKPRNQKPKSLSEIQQAGSGGVLVDQSGRAVYYATHMDPVYFATAQQYYGAANYAKAPPATPFPVNATVFKTAWRIVQPNAIPTDAYSTQATIALLESDGQGGLRTSGQTQNATVALVGVHVVGVVQDHPEFLWATFEQTNNAPDLPPNVQPGSSDPVSSRSFTFYRANTPANASNQMPTSYTIDPATQAISPATNAFRQFAWGGATPDRVQDITSSNKNFQDHIRGGGAKSIDQVFANYVMHGTVWILANTLQPGDGNLDTQAIGSPSLASSVMETFVQGAGTNCFSCHNTSGGSGYPGKDINLSHVILGSLAPNPELLRARR